MADNVVADPGSGGATFATDEDGSSVHHPYVKIEWGGADTFTKLSTGTASLPAQGAAAHDAAAAGNPLLVGAEFDDTLPDSVDEGDVGRLRISGNRNLYATIRDAAGNERGLNVDANGNLGATLAAGTNAIGKLAANSGVDIGDVDVTSISAGANLIGDVGISGARTSGGTTIFRSIDLDETEEEVKGSAGQIYWIHAMNLAATKRFLKIYSAPAASVTVGSTTPVMTLPLPTQGDANGAGFFMAIPNGIAIGGTGLSVAATTGIADADTGAPGANEVVVHIGYA